MKFIEGSPSFSREILPRLADMGIKQGTQELEDFFTFGQQIFDPADPVNYTRTPHAKSATVLFQYVAGDRSGDDISYTDPDTGVTETLKSWMIFPPDETNPISVINDPAYNYMFQRRGLGEKQVVETAPHAGATPLWQSMGLVQVNPTGPATYTEVENSRAVVRFVRGGHSSLLDFTSGYDKQKKHEPGVAIEVTREMQTQIALFFRSAIDTVPTVHMLNNTAGWTNPIIESAEWALEVDEDVYPPVPDPVPLEP